MKKRTPYTRIKRTRLTESERQRLDGLHRAVIGVGSQLEQFMIDVGQMQPSQRRVMTSEMLRQVDRTVKK